ncbi:hypothetical protein SKAU_G00395760 [Synaphobranchus kaupii]|uniref:Uncharacterized protein n=1 Tax=Synaphobranchus kaupii TaxID=118154 RepID=A0A9Q1ECG2_SYNKA|nr:hypothetical protein SKAU_G00395760 [Synaphobranchus kaupii]
MALLKGAGSCLPTVQPAKPLKRCLPSGLLFCRTGPEQACLSLECGPLIRAKERRETCDSFQEPQRPGNRCDSLRENHVASLHCTPP